jgi:integrase
MRLNATTVRTITCAPGKSVEVVFDEGLPGFGLCVRPTGTKSWVVQYAIAGRTRRVTLGTTAVLDPGQAREAAKGVLAKVRLGGDPAAEKVQARIRAGETFGALLPRFLARQRERLKPRSYEETERHLVAHCKSFHILPLDAVDRRTIAARLAEIAERNGPCTCNRVRASVSAFFTWLAREGYVEANPVLYTNRATENGARERVLSDDELAAIYHAAGDGQYGSIVRLLMLTSARRDEIASLRWSEVNFDEALISLSAARTKSRREHLIPLSPAACAILAAQPRRTEADGSERDLIFGTAPGRPWQDWSGSKAELDARLGNAFEWTLHDFRRSLSTWAHETGTLPHVVETLLGHVAGHKAGPAGVYNKALYLLERQRILDRWAAHITTVVTGEPAEAVVVRLPRPPAPRASIGPG